MIYKNDIDTLKTDIKQMIGHKIMVKGSSGRSKFFEKEATLKSAYPNLFVVTYNETDENATYSYTDVLTKNVELQVFDGENYSPMKLPVIETKKEKKAINIAI